MSSPNYVSPGGEVVVDQFVSNEHWDEAREALSAAGVDLAVFEGEGTNLSIVRAMAHAKVEREISGQQAPQEQLARLGKAYERSVDRLIGQVTEVQEQITSARFGFCAFGIAVPNPDYQPPVVTHRADGGVSISYPSNSWNNNRYIFLDRTALKIWPRQARSASITLLYQERI